MHGARRRTLRLTLIVALVGAALVPRPAADAAPSCDWPMYGHDLGHSFATAGSCTTLSPLTAPSLAPSWGYLTPDSFTASPTVVDGVAYGGDWTGRFYALPLTQGSMVAKPKWIFQVDDPNHVAFGKIVASAAVTSIDGTRVVVFAGGATVYALRASDGHLLARLCLDPRSNPAVRCKGTADGSQVEIESSPSLIPRAHGAQVLVGLDVHNDAKVGRTGLVSSVLTRNGTWGWSFTPTWKFDPEGGPQGATYRGTDLLTKGSGTGTGCASVWSSPAIDVTQNLAFFGTGSCGAAGVTVGEDAYAVRLSDGAFVWRYDAPRENPDWDDDFGASPNLLPGNAVGFGSKDGKYYALSRRHGTVQWITTAGQAGHVEDGFAVGGIIGTPALGTVGGRPAIFATTAISTPIHQPLDEGDPVGSVDTSLVDDPTRLFSLSAIDATTGAILWRSPLSRQSYGAPTFANGVVLVPSTFSFQLLAFQADTGVPLATMPLVGASSSSPTIVGDTILIGTGTRTSDLEFKAFGASAAETFLGASPLSPASGLFAYKIVAPPLNP